MTEELRAKVENKVLKIAKLADEICESVYACEECPLHPQGYCMVEDVCEAAVDIQEKRAEKPTYEQLPIDLDDCKCDSCIKPSRWGCYNTDECREGYPLGECCADNLEDNVGKLCFDNNLPSKLAKDIIGLIKKERERNESLYVHREYFQDK